jgi:hypothetical protein
MLPGRGASPALGSYPLLRPGERESASPRRSTRSEPRPYKSRASSIPGPMRFSWRPSRVWSLVTLRGTRSLLSGPPYRILVGLIGLGYALGAMVFGGMLYLPSSPLKTGWFVYVYPSGPGPSWTYPAILAGGPNFFVDLPIVSAILMTLSAAGVGLGMSLAVLLGVRLTRRRRAGLLRPTVVGSAAGLTPVMIALVTLGACCSTTAAATAGIGLAAQSSGTTPAAALANAWYLGVFQVVVIYVALIAQEQLLSVYGLLFGGPTAGPPTPGAETGKLPPLGWRGAGSALLRIALVTAGVTWSLSMFTDWFSTPPARASAAAWLGWTLQHQVPGILAVLVALFPAGALAFWTKLTTGRWALAIRGVLATSGVALLTWIPAPLSGAGAAALGNELLGYWGFPSSWGAVAPPALGLVGLSLRWTFQFGLLGIVAVGMGISPEITLKPLLRSSAARSRTATSAVAREPTHLLSDSG